MFSVVAGLVVCFVVVVFATKRRRRTGDPIFGLGAVSTQWLIDHRTEGH
jgi:hypothetical protein